MSSEETMVFRRMMVESSVYRCWVNSGARSSEEGIVGMENPPEVAGELRSSVVMGVVPNSTRNSGVQRPATVK
jgi:hypothetical protein